MTPVDIFMCRSNPFLTEWVRLWETSPLREPVELLTSGGIISVNTENLKDGRPAGLEERYSAFHRCNIPRLSRLAMAGQACARCGESPRYRLGKRLFTRFGMELTIDHIVPTSKGGGNEIENLQLMCFACNKIKANTLDDDQRAMDGKTGKTWATTCNFQQHAL